ncbi:MAG TPA: hypothetical protein VK425_11810, partial [Acidimicrobiales bacterium]|nr:hypothetical protein [Acidimicrobiales bacterium]
MRQRLFFVALCPLGFILTACGTSTYGAAPPGHGHPGPFLSQFHSVSQIASTVPANGDLNPYGVAVVPRSSGRLAAGDILVSNFNDRGNVQGTGTTIVEISPTRKSVLFAQLGHLPAGERCPGGIGLTLALGVLPGGWVIVGSLPTGKGGALPQNV